ncbi:MAG: M29 family metallopeptidase [Candidatus Aminicenantales bacterium]
MANLTPRELVDLVRSVFPRLPGDGILSILIDIPRDPDRDNPAWQERRLLAFEWMGALYDHRLEIPMDDVRLIAYPDTGSNNADFPAEAYLCGALPPPDASALGQVAMRVPFEDILAESQIILAPTEYSTTAPLKVAAKKFGFRAATMPGFSVAMIPALRIDYVKVARLVQAVKDRLDKAAGADVLFRVDGRQEYRMHFDLRGRTAHSSTGRFPDPGTAGNLPSGEAYIVPNEGEGKTASATAGILPVEIGGEVVLYEIKRNKAVSVEAGGPAAAAEREYLSREPAYGNMAELGFGVLAEFGLAPCGEVLLDEKLGLHVAFGRSEHFGGSVGPNDFSAPAAVIHLDRIYIPKVQPRIEIAEVTFSFGRGRSERVMKDGKYVIF